MIQLKEGGGSLNVKFANKQEQKQGWVLSPKFIKEMHGQDKFDNESLKETEEILLKKIGYKKD